MSIEKAKEHIKKYGLENKIMIFDTSSATVELAAQAVGCEPERIAKTLSFKVDGKAILIVTAGDTKINNSKYKQQFSAKATMLSPDEAISLVGHAVGGVCPFGINEGIDVYLDNSLQRFSSVFPACGSSNSAIELTLDELEKCAEFKEWIDVCKLPEGSL